MLLFSVIITLVYSQQIAISGNKVAHIWIGLDDAGQPPFGLDEKNSDPRPSLDES